MSDLRQAAQQALEALEYTIKPLCMCWAGCENCDPSKAPDIEKAITDLRAALAQQAEPAQAPAYKVKVAGRWHDAEPFAAAFDLPDGEHLLYTAPPQRPADPVQKPVAWNWMLDGRPYGQVYYGNPPDADIAERAAIAGRTVRLLYAAPQPQRPPLTDEEIRAHADKHLRYQPQSYEASGVFDLVRAIERAVRGE